MRKNPSPGSRASSVLTPDGVCDLVCRPWNADYTVSMAYAQFKHCEECDQEYWAERPDQRFCCIPCRTANRWSVYDDRLVYWRRDYLNGDSYKTIADREGLTPNTVRGALQYAGVEPRNKWDRAVELNCIQHARAAFVSIAND